MQQIHARSRALFGAFVLGLSLATSAIASGTLSPGGGSDPVAQGRKVYLQKIACSSCPVPGGVSDKAAAMSLVERVQADEFSLSRRERGAVVSYLNRRWRLG